jgi:hypothetical protein
MTDLVACREGVRGRNHNVLVDEVESHKAFLKALLRAYLAKWIE